MKTLEEIKEKELKQDTESMLQMIPSSYDRRKFRGLIQRIKTFESKKHTKVVSQTKQELIGEIKETLFSGEGRKTGVWHYEVNDNYEMEAGYMGEYLSMSEVRKVLDNLSHNRKP